jgi:hypothetical protein
MAADSRFDSWFFYRPVYVWQLCRSAAIRGDPEDIRCRAIDGGIQVADISRASCGGEDE